MPATRNSTKSSSVTTKSHSPPEEHSTPSPSVEPEASTSLNNANHPPPEKERSRNAKAQARHREKRKAYIEHLEKSVQTLKAQLAAMGISSPSPSILASPQEAAANEARLRALTEENDRLKRDIRSLRDRLEVMGGRGGGPGGYLPHLVPTLSMPEDTMRRRTFDEGGHGHAGSSYMTASSESPYTLVPLSLGIPPPPSPPVSSLPSHLQPPYNPHRHGSFNTTEEPYGQRMARGPLSASHMTQHRHSLPSPFTNSPYTPSPLRDSPAPNAPLPPGLGLQQQQSSVREWPPLLQPPLPQQQQAGFSGSSASSYTFSPSAPPSRTTSTSPPRSAPVSPETGASAGGGKKGTEGYDSFGWPPADVQAEEPVA